MIHHVHEMHIKVKHQCAQQALIPSAVLLHSVHMKKKRPVPKTYLREWREHAGYSLERAADVLDITYGTLSKVERGLSAYQPYQLEALAALYGCKTGDLLNGPPGEGTPETDRDRRAKVIQIYDHADLSQKRQIEAVAETIVGVRHQGGG
jgi:transcriptional regulator with XRE-family HTH domain